MGGGPEVWRATAGGVALRVRLTPKAAADAVTGVGDTREGPALLARVRAVPERGAANLALEKLVAGWLGLPRSAVAVAAGGKSRLKTVTVAGDARALAQQVRDRLGTLG
jgi:uncharacterized protein YggU (UPF0235/DUF167 family)